MGQRFDKTAAFLRSVLCVLASLREHLRFRSVTMSFTQRRQDAKRSKIDQRPLILNFLLDPFYIRIISNEPQAIYGSPAAAGRSR